MLSKTAQKAIEAYGGIEFWKSHKFIEAEVSVNGLAFTLKRRPIFEHAKIRMEIARPFSKITPIGKNKNIVGAFCENDVWLEDLNGGIIAMRKNARTYFPYGRRLFYWDDLDMAYFANYAFWNYFTLPNLLMNDSIDWIEKKEGYLIAKFPKNFPTHSKLQEFYFDINTGLLMQHNYTADVISGLANAANVVISHSNSENAVFGSKRIVTPKSITGNPFKKPVLIDITVHNFILLKF